MRSRLTSAVIITFIIPPPSYVVNDGVARKYDDYMSYWQDNYLMTCCPSSPSPAAKKENLLPLARYIYQFPGNAIIRKIGWWGNDKVSYYFNCSRSGLSLRNVMLFSYLFTSKKLNIPFKTNGGPFYRAGTFQICSK